MKHGIGLIGCGSIAGAWIKAVEQHPDCRILLTFDLSPEAAQKRAEEAGTQAALSLEQVWDSAEIDLVIIGTPTPTHPELVIQAAQAGKHLLCEKPMALNLKLCQQMIEACQRAKVKLAIGHSLRFWGAFLTCRRLVEEGAIGAPVSGSIDRMGIARPRRTGEEKQPSQHWRAQLANTGGNVLEGFIHELDFARAVFGEVASVSCEISGGQEYRGLLSPPILQALILFTSGALVTARTGSTVALPSRGCWIGGTEGGLCFSAWGGPVEHYRHDWPEKRLVPCQDTYAYYLELSDVLKAIETGGEPENSGLNGKKNVALGLALYRSFETGRRLHFAQGLPQDVAEEYQNTRWH
jgi:predicted dehydrogenase